MGLGTKLRDLDRRAQDRVPRMNPRESTAMRMGVGFLVGAGLVAALDMLTGLRLSTTVLAFGWIGGLWIGRATEARAVRRGQGGLRPDVDDERSAVPPLPDS